MEQVFEDVAPNGNRLVINRNKRCVRCNAYQVLEEVSEALYEDNLADATIAGKEVFVCKDDAECAKNKLNQETMVTIITEEAPGEKAKISGYKMFAPNGDFLEVNNIG